MNEKTLKFKQKSVFFIYIKAFFRKLKSQLFSEFSVFASKT